MKKLFVIHPFLFAVYPVLFLYSHNIEQSSLSDIIWPVIVLVLFITIAQTLLTLVFYKTTKQQIGKLKIALVISLFLIVFFSYGHVFNLLEGFSIAGYLIGRDRYILIMSFIVLATGTYFIIRTKKNLQNLSKTLNVAAGILVIITIGNISIYELKDDVNSMNIEGVGLENSKGSSENIKELPDIYYIILDAYASSKTLREIYGFDNSGFENFLKDKGFYIASRSRSNYAETRLSLSSSLNMVHINTFGDKLDLPMLHKLFQENKVTRILKSKGYNIVNISSNIGKFQNLKYADWNVKCGSFLADEFQTTLIETTILGAFKQYIHFAYFYREKILCTLSTLGEVKNKIRKPFFVFAHIMPPHPPYVFGPHAEPVNSSLDLTNWGKLWVQKERYIDQVIFVNNEMKKIIPRILKSEREPIIIIQGDHGPQITSKTTFEDEAIKARMRILNAFYLPKNDSSFLYDSITPVNTFRLIFNRYFNMKYESQEDKSYFTRYAMPYKFKDVTDVTAQF